MIRTATTVTLLLACMAAPALGDGAGSEIPPVATQAGLAGVYHVLDCTQEGFINAGEAIEHGGTLFRHLDRDRSGLVSRDEYVRAVHKRLAPIRHAYFDEMDADGDGLITIQDYTDHLTVLIDAGDTNRDGDTAWQEILTLRGEAGQQAAVDYDHDHHH